MGAVEYLVVIVPCFSVSAGLEDLETERYQCEDVKLRWHCGGVGGCKDGVGRGVVDGTGGVAKEMEAGCEGYLWCCSGNDDLSAILFDLMGNRFLGCGGVRKSENV